MLRHSVFVFGLLCCMSYLSDAVRSDTDSVIIEHSFDGQEVCMIVLMWVEFFVSDCLMLLFVKIVVFSAGSLCDPA
jgi:hypothetical protein